MNALSIQSRSIFGLSIGLLSALFAAPAVAEATDAAALIKTAVQGTGQARYTAIDDLGERHIAGAKVVPELQKLLADKDAQVRWRSARALGDYGGQATSAAPELRKLLKDSDAIVQYHAAVALGRVSDKSDETVLALVTAATSKDGRVARAAIAAIRELEPGRDHVVKALGEVLKSDDDAVVLHALEALVEHGAEAVPTLIEALKRPETAYLACTAIEHIGPDAAATVPALTELIGKTRHSHLLIQALLAIASIGPAADSAAPKIVPLLESSPDATVPVAAAYALGSIDAKGADAALRRALEKNNPFLQMIAAWALAKLHPDDTAAEKLAVEKLVQGLKNNDARIRTAAAKSLQSLQAPPEMVAPMLVQLANDPDPEVHKNVVEAIAGLGEPVVPRVIKALENPQLREAAVHVLRKLGPKAAGAVQPLINASTGANSKLRTEIQMTLGAIGPAAAPATDMLVKSLASNDAGERESALFALRKIGPAASAAVKPLLQRMQADESFESNAAAWALVQIAPMDSQVAAALVPKFSHGLTSADEQVRLESAEGLAVLGAAAKAAAPALENAAREDSSAEVRAAAESALRRVRS
ncbi:MAG: HEAT repeat domain-containing protein [Planctomycetes bacterium]|nr:HEAT repeat domain-containing protein [Planctomycetota bacterium]